MDNQTTALDRIASALERIATALESGAQVAKPATAPAPVAKPNTRASEEPAKAVQAPVSKSDGGATVEDVRAAFINVFKLNPDSARDVLKKFNLVSIAKAAPSDYDALLDAFNRAGV